MTDKGESGDQTEILVGNIGYRTLITKEKKQEEEKDTSRSMGSKNLPYPCLINSIWMLFIGLGLMIKRPSVAMDVLWNKEFSK